MNKAQPLVLLSLLMLPATANPVAISNRSVSPPSPTVEKAVRSTPPTLDLALLQRRRDQIDGLTRQMQALKAQLDGLRYQLGVEADETDRAAGRVARAAKQQNPVHAAH